MQPEQSRHWLSILDNFRSSLWDISGPFSPTPPGSLVGVECEFSIFEETKQIDFRTLIHEFAKTFPEEIFYDGGFRYHTMNGFKLYSDGWYVEIVSPPELLAPNLPLRLADSVLVSTRWLIRRIEDFSKRMGRSYKITGTSMHLSINSPENRLNDLTFRLAVCYGPLFVFMTSFPCSAGVVFHPRPSRLEIAIEYIPERSRLQACLTFLIGAFFEVHDTWVTGRSLSDLSLPATHLEAPEIRPGWELTPSSTSPQLFSHKRTAGMTTSGGHSISLQHYLENTWQAILPYLRNILHSSEIELANDYIIGKRKGGIESHPSEQEREANSEIVIGIPSQGILVFGRAMQPRAIRNWMIKPFFMDWNFLLLHANSGNQTYFILLPRRYLVDYGIGNLDNVLNQALTKFSHAMIFESDVLLHQLSDTIVPSIFTQVDLKALLLELETASRTLPDETKPVPAAFGCMKVREKAGQITGI